MTKPKLGRGRGQTLVKGHALIEEGQPFTAVGTPLIIQGPGHGKCECGALSPELASNGARKRWHRQHKEEVLRGA